MSEQEITFIEKLVSDLRFLFGTNVCGEASDWLSTAADRLENFAWERDQLKEERDEARAEVERLKAEVNTALAAEERAKKSRDEAWCRANEARAETEAPTVNQSLTVRPEPSRLEIAAMAMQAFISRPGLIIDIPKNAMAYADALIAAAKEGK